MLSDKDIDVAAQQLANYRKNDALPDILTNFENLIEDYKRLRCDYEEAREARERWKQEAREARESCKRQARDQERYQERNPYVLVLVDGDGYVFNDHCKCLSSYLSHTWAPYVPHLPYLVGRVPSTLSSEISLASSTPEPSTLTL